MLKHKKHFEKGEIVWVKTSKHHPILGKVEAVHGENIFLVNVASFNIDGGYISVKELTEHGEVHTCHANNLCSKPPKDALWAYNRVFNKIKPRVEELYATRTRKAG